MQPKGLNLTCEVQNLTISYNDLGDGDLPIIFLHGFPFNKNMWQAQIEYLQKTTRVIAVDLRGFGASTDEMNALSIGLFADDLIKFMNALKIDKAVICGLSMGGYIALNAVQRFPSRFSAMILCDTQCNADSNDQKEKRNKTIEEVKNYGTKTFNEQFIKSVFHKDTFENDANLVEFVTNMVFSNSTHIVAAGIRALADRAEACSELNCINIPTLIICGREDAVTPLKQSVYMQSIIKNSVLRIIDNAGHVSNLEQPNAFNQHIFEFTNALSLTHQANTIHESF